MFPTKFTYKSEEQETTPTGKAIQIKAVYGLNENGVMVVDHYEKIDLNAKIQAYAEECDIHNIISKFMAGDKTVLEKVQGQYLDVSDVPSSLAEAQRLIYKNEREFETLPKEIKSKFEYDVRKYIAQFGTKEWEDKIGLTEMRANKKAKEEARAKYEADKAKAYENLAKGGKE